MCNLVCEFCLKKMTANWGSIILNPSMHAYDQIKKILYFLFLFLSVYNLFNYECDNQGIPFMIKNQPDSEQLCYYIDDDMELVFTFPKCSPSNVGLVWRYSMMFETCCQTLETVHGYFKLSDSQKTVLDLSKSYDKQRLKWLYFTAIHQDNPMRRAWFNTIQGPAFGEPQCDSKSP